MTETQNATGITQGRLRFSKAAYIKEQNAEDISAHIRKKKATFSSHYKCSCAERVKQKQGQTAWIMGLRSRGALEMRLGRRAVGTRRGVAGVSAQPSAGAPRGPAG